MAGDIDLNAFGATHQGLVRENNQDQFLIAQLSKSMRVSATSMSFDQRLYGQPEGEVLLVADGMGGHAAGEKASSLAIETMVRRLLDSIHAGLPADDSDDTVFRKNLEELLKDAHSRILVESAHHADQRGMGTTLTMAYVIWPRLYVAHAGDSRCYLIRDGQAQPLTTDHTLARQMVDAGGLKPEDEAKSKWSNVLWNVLGGRVNGDLIAEVHRFDLKPGDAIVLCSDGLHRYVDADQLATIVNESESPEVACQRLIQIALDAGGEDNVTVIVSSPLRDDPSKSTWIDAYDTSVPDGGKSTASLGTADADGFSSGEVDSDDGPDPLADTMIE
ncbi:Serine/threonine phosphatase stp [Rubripirellula lacrimiformis]|uniref:Serine/threonine phosphatase stp n=2 Tax=Rubripirellula lacrimiformis TaxID=1930273 RepID=A0A517N5J8_9BACT|nr:Serine/threonine phosphatase stp [Rubripirellula lacrimiformis]